MELSLLLSVSIWIRVSVCVCVSVLQQPQLMVVCENCQLNTDLYTYFECWSRDREWANFGNRYCKDVTRLFIHTQHRPFDPDYQNRRKKQQQHNKNNCNTKNEKRTMKITRNRPATSNQQYTVLTQYHIIHTEPKMIFLFIPISFNWNQFLLFNLTVNLIVSLSLTLSLVRSMLIISAVVVAVIIIIIVISHYILVNERVPQLIISTKEQKKAHTHTLSARRFRVFGFHPYGHWFTMHFDLVVGSSLTLQLLNCIALLYCV